MVGFGQCRFRTITGPLPITSCDIYVELHGTSLDEKILTWQVLGRLFKWRQFLYISLLHCPACWSSDESKEPNEALHSDSVVIASTCGCACVWVAIGVFHGRRFVGRLSGVECIPSCWGCWWPIPLMGFDADVSRQGFVPPCFQGFQTQPWCCNLTRTRRWGCCMGFFRLQNLRQSHPNEMIDMKQQKTIWRYMCFTIYTSSLNMYKYTRYTLYIWIHRMCTCIYSLRIM